MKRIVLGMVLAVCGLTVYAQPKVVAHRGYWKAEGCSQNSIAALRAAADLGCYGAEFDVWVTADGVPVVFHDPTIDGIRIEDTMYATLMNHRLSNGEFLPTLQQYLMEAARLKPQLILEIKGHRGDERDIRAARKVVELIKMMGLENKTEYISFSLCVCRELHSLQPKAKVAYLEGDISPKAIKKLGLTGVDYHFDVLKKHPEWLTEAQKCGVEVNVWTVDGEEALAKHAATKGIDIITTNDPNLLIKK